MRKVLIFHNIIAPYRLPLFESIGERLKGEYEVEVCFLTERYKDRLWDTKINAKYFKWKVLPGITITLPIINIPISINWGFFKKIKESDVIIINGVTDFTTLIAFLISRLTRKKTILWLEATGQFLSPIGGKVFNLLFKLTVPHSDCILTACVKAKKYYAKFGINPRNIKVYQNSSDPKRYATFAKKVEKDSKYLKKKYNINKKRIILYVGRLIERKGILELIDAFKDVKDKVPNACLVIAGSGPLREKIEEKIKEYDLKDVLLLGFISEEEKIQFCLISDVFILPSKLDFVPLIFSEVMGCGIPVIATSTIGNVCDIIIEGKNGYIVEVNNVENLSNTMRMILTLPPKKLEK